MSEVIYMGLYVCERFGIRFFLLILLTLMVCRPAFATDPVPAGTTPDPVPAGTTPDSVPAGTTPDSVPKPSGAPNTRFTFSEPREIEFSMTGGLRKDQLDWSIAGTAAGVNPDVLSELEWSSVDSYQITLANRSRFRSHLYSRTVFNYAWIQDGTVRDSDYDGDNRTLEWSRSISESTGDEVWDFSTGVGYAFILARDRLLLAPVIGFSFSKQNLRIQNGNQVVSTRSPAPAVGPLSSQLDSTYFARWMGPWIGCDLQYRKAKRHPDALAMQFGLSAELHYADYYGEGNWNLRSDLNHPRSFEHDAEGYGICISGEWLISLTPRWNLNMAAAYQYWDTGTGTDRKFLTDGSTAVTLMNGVTWSSSSFMVGASYHF
jgi:hypothetical protein